MIRVYDDLAQLVVFVVEKILFNFLFNFYKIQNI